MRLVTDTIEFGTRHMPRWNTISICGYHIREAGATAVQELAFTIADGLAYVEAALKRGKEVGEEYETVEVETDLVRARSVGAGIVDEARRRNVELIVMGGEPPTRVRGGAILGGIGGSRPPEVGEVTEYVLKKAPCRVLLTAPPEG